jgi:hypothetical protein
VPVLEVLTSLLMPFDHMAVQDGLEDRAADMIHREADRLAPLPVESEQHEES